jgi:hypothetical protein
VDAVLVAVYDAMKMKKQILIALPLIAAGAVLAHLHVASQTYHPVVQITSPEGLTLTAVQDPPRERQACGAANERVIGPMKAHCKDCRVIFARCERELEGVELALVNGGSVPYYRLYSPGARMVIAGPAATAKAFCETVAGSLVKQGWRSATCVNPS